LWLLDILIFPWFCFYVKKQNPDVIYSNTSAENIGILIAKMLNIKHISHIREFMSLDYKIYFLGGDKLKKRYIKQSDGIVYVSHSVAKQVNQSEKLPENQQIIYNGVNSPKIEFAEKELPQVINFGIIGIFDPAKGQDVAIDYYKDVLEKFPDSRLHIFGDKEGTYKKKLLSMVNKYGLSQNVIFHGFESDQEKIYNKIDVLLVCSLFEGFGRVTIEAMQRAIPVIGYDNAGTSELIEHGKDGFLFNSKKEFLLALETLLSTTEKFNTIRKQAFIKANSEFSTDIYCSKIDSFLNKIVNKE